MGTQASLICRRFGERGHHENVNPTEMEEFQRLPDGFTPNVFGYQELTLFGLRVHVVIVEITDITWGPPWSLGVVGSGHTRRGIVSSAAACLVAPLWTCIGWERRRASAYDALLRVLALQCLQGHQADVVCAAALG